MRTEDCGQVKAAGIRELFEAARARVLTGDVVLLFSRLEVTHFRGSRFELKK